MDFCSAIVLVWQLEGSPKRGWMGEVMEELLLPTREWYAVFHAVRLDDESECHGLA